VHSTILGEFGKTGKIKRQKIKEGKEKEGKKTQSTVFE
jgi:hypothetical protein